MFKIKKAESGIDEKYGLAEIGQSMSTQQAILIQGSTPDELIKTTPFVKCRDFLVDSYTCALANKPGSVWGYHFDGKKETLSWDHVRLLVKFHKPEHRQNFEKQFLWAVHQIEKQNNIPLSEVHECDMKDCLVILADKRWLENCLTFSMYCFFPRLACYNVPESKSVEAWLAKLANQKTSDGAYVKSIAMSTWTKLVRNLDLLKQDSFCGLDPVKDGIHAVHHNSGFISVLGSHSEMSKSTVMKNSHWQTMTTRDVELYTKAA
jgi:hypothetical protein